MKITKLVNLIILALVASITVYSQTRDWAKLILLESNRTEVEKIIGKPERYFETYGIYQTEIGRFYVWYSQGGCQKNVEGLQYNIPARKLTRIVFSPKISLPLESYVSDKEDFKKERHSTMDSRYFYTSTDETITYETVLPNNGREFVYTIELQPGTDKQYLLCKDMK